MNTAVSAAATSCVVTTGKRFTIPSGSPLVIYVIQSSDFVGVAGLPF
jgi:hypothetical protein